jgi:hypothetical protein
MTAAQPAGPAHGPDTGSYEVSLRVIYEEKAIDQAQGSSLMIPPVSAQCPAGRVVPVRVAGPAAAAGRPVPGDV